MALRRSVCWMVCGGLMAGLSGPSDALAQSLPPFLQVRASYVETLSGPDEQPEATPNLAAATSNPLAAATPNPAPATSARLDRLDSRQRRAAMLMAVGSGIAVATLPYMFIARRMNSRCQEGHHLATPGYAAAGVGGVGAALFATGGGLTLTLPSGYHKERPMHRDSKIVTGMLALWGIAASVATLTVSTAVDYAVSCTPI